MYSLANYGEMLNDQARTTAYIEALKQVINDQSIVLDIGTGTGIFSLIACHLGARKVYAIEPGEIIGLARDIAIENGFIEKITFIQDFSTAIDLPEKATVVVSDIRGKLPLYANALPSIIDARKRHLDPGGVLIPASDTLLAALVSAPMTYQEYTNPWNDVYHYDIKMETALHKIKNSIWVAKKNDLSLITEPQQWISLDYYQLEDTDVAVELTWQIKDAGIVHGISLWFETSLQEGIGFSDQPGQGEHIYGGWFLPFYEPVQLNAGDTVMVELHANLVGEDYECRWKSQVFGKQDSTNPMTRFKQSTFEGEFFSLSELQKRSATYSAELDQNGKVHYEILKQMNAGRKLEDIAKYVIEKFPGHFKNFNQALSHVGELSIRYSK